MVLNEEAQSTSSEAGVEPPKKRRRCHICPRTNDRKIKQQCQTCKKNVCNQHSEMLLKCNKCKGKRLPIQNPSDSDSADEIVEPAVEPTV